MITKDTTPASRRRIRYGLPLLAAIFAIGVAISLQEDDAEPKEPPATSQGDGPFGAGPGPAAHQGFPELRIEIEDRHAAVIEKARAEAMTEGIILSRPEHEVPATVRLGDERRQAIVRLKGDWTDHVDSDKWSLRIEVQGGSLGGMSRFSVQHPKTRAYVFEWLIMEAGRREGLLVPRSQFVNVTINGRSSGLYYLEEHFTKEMLESQGRREGAIVKFREDTLWTTRHQYGLIGEDIKPPLVLARSITPGAAEPGAFDARRMGKVEALNQRLQRALEQIRQLQRDMLTELPAADPARMQALEELQGRSIDDLFVTEAMGRRMALFALFRTSHGLMWHQFRFYHDPLLDRLEPILFDTGADPISGYPLTVLMPFLVHVRQSDEAYEACFRALGRISEPEWLTAFEAATAPTIDAVARALHDEELIPPQFSPAMVWQALRSNAADLREMVRPQDPANFLCRMVEAESSDGERFDLLEVEAWSTTEVPVEVEGFQFSNGRIVRAVDAIAEDAARRRRDQGRVALPRRGRHLLFSFPADERLAALRAVQDIKRAIRTSSDRDQSAKLRVKVLFRPIAGDETTAEPLRIDKVGDPGMPLQGRPRAPSLIELLEHHPFLSYDFEQARLMVRPGVWDVAGDLVIPPGIPLHAGPGVTLRFATDAVMVSESPLQFLGDQAAPITIEAQDHQAGWSGLVVLGADHSRLHQVVIRQAREIARGGWQISGGVTFYRSPVEMKQVRIEDGRGEDALNIFGTSFRLERVTIDGGASDLFDGDFVRGEIHDCDFAHSVEDAVDLSGSTVTATDCRFEAIGDKAFSVGEDTRITIRDCTVASASIGLAAKDLSEVEVDGLSIEHAVNFGVAVYIKKPEYGASQVTATRLTIGSAGRAPYLVQQGCELRVDGELVPTEAVDVGALYRDKILGR